MKSKDFTLSVDAANTTRAHLSWINCLYEDVEIRFEKSSSTARTKIEWVSLLGPNEESLQKTKNYITSLTSPTAKAIIKTPPSFKEELFKEDSKLLKQFERESSGVILCSPNSDETSIQGVDELIVVLGKSLIDDALEKHKESIKHTKETTDTELNKLCESVKRFGIKLGYNDEDIMHAAEKCTANGKIVNANTLLQELVKSCPQKLKDTIFNTDLEQEDERLFVEITCTIAEVTNAQTTTASSGNGFCASLRNIVIDGSNVALCHGHKEIFSCSGIDIVVNWFKQRGHRNIVVFVPQWRLEAPKADSPITDQNILDKLHKEKILVFTPSRRINGRRVVCYDDRYIVKYAYETDGVIVSNDNFRDLIKESPEYKLFIEQRLLMYSFVQDRFMPPDDPQGRCGPTLNEFLKKGSLSSRICPYKNKCTYGSKCRYYHPEKESSSTAHLNSCETTSSVVNTPITSTILPHSGNTTRNNTRLNCEERLMHNASLAYNSCAMEQLAYENNSYYTPHEIIAKGCTSLPCDFLQKQSASDCREQQQQSNLYQHLPSYYPQAQQQRQTLPPTQYYLQTSYSLPPAHTTYSLHESTSFTPQMYAPHQPQQLNNTVMSSYQPLNSPQLSYQPPPNHPSFSIMPGYIDPRTLNQYYRATVPQINSQYMQPMSLSVETPVVCESLPGREYLLRSDNHSSSPSLQQQQRQRNDSYLQRLLEMFPNQQHIVYKVLKEHPNEADINRLVSFVLAE